MCRKNVSYYETVFVRFLLFPVQTEEETGYHVNKREEILTRVEILPFQKNNSLGLSKIKCFREKNVLMYKKEYDLTAKVSLLMDLKSLGDEI